LGKSALIHRVKIKIYLKNYHLNFGQKCPNSHGKILFDSWAASRTGFECFCIALILMQITTDVGDLTKCCSDPHYSTYQRAVSTLSIVNIVLTSFLLLTIDL
jgi:hypothetical protein